MDKFNLPIGSIVISNNTRLLIVGFNNNSNSYLVCVCDKDKVNVNKLYGLNSVQIEKVLSLGYVDLNNNNIPKPLPVNNPASNIPTDIKPDRYSSVIITEAAQLGISPIKLAIK